VPNDLRERFAGLPDDRLEKSLRLERGGKNDYLALSEHHYKAPAPATMPRVFVFRHRRFGVAGRYLGRSGETAVAAVLTESYPMLSCRLRNWALNGRYRGLVDLKQRAVVLNAEVRCISRVVVHPQWRGLGLAVKLVRAVLADPATIFTEALAAMGHANPFFERAGMMAYHRHPHDRDARLISVFEAIGIEAIDLADLQKSTQRIDRLSDIEKQWVLHELKRWCRGVFRRSKNACESLEEQLRLVQQRLLCEPVYYLKDNR